MNLTATIESAELRFRQILEEFFVAVYDENKLPSHGLFHHRRVWKYCRELLFISAANSEDLTCEIPELIIAAYLHDIGMTIDHGPRHGQYSRELCRQFLGNYNLPESDFPELLETLVRHDMKDYEDKSTVNNLLRFLSVADDLDALGYTGIYRYSEIYLARGIKHADLGNRIIDNVSGRFNNFIRSFGSDTEYAGYQENRYKILRTFFEDYNRCAAVYDFDSAEPSGHCGVIQIFTRMLNDNLSFADLLSLSEQFCNDETIRSYFEGLRSEI